ncbi:hypothetical protein PRZ48_002059 [Zasmidium cellare]|uniref:DUF2293 domain-containing protein n=1 Tax=Zasmidium cellare TaxID=395010 RepID=A0ABR0F2Z4_ZASCE|nr:hypothetical protein PRZ48_002059 [Zasmidium cellare]
MSTRPRRALADLTLNQPAPGAGLAASIHAPPRTRKTSSFANNTRKLMSTPTTNRPDLTNLTPAETRLRRREWNRGPLTDLFPLIPSTALDRILDICIDVKDYTYNLSESKNWNHRRLTSIVVAHVRHAYSDYDKLLREDKLERYEARRRSGDQVWRVLREWCPWDDSNPVLEQAWRATLVPPEERDPTWDPMDVDEESDGEGEVPTGVGGVVEFEDDPMDLD